MLMLVKVLLLLNKTEVSVTVYEVLLNLAEVGISIHEVLRHTKSTIVHSVVKLLVVNGTVVDVQISCHMGAIILLIVVCDKEVVSDLNCSWIKVEGRREVLLVTTTALRRMSMIQIAVGTRNYHFS